MAGPTAPGEILKITPALMSKVALSVVLLSSGIFYLVTGRRESNFGRMLMGAILALASLFAIF